METREGLLRFLGFRRPASPADLGEALVPTSDASGLAVRAPSADRAPIAAGEPDADEVEPDEAIELEEEPFGLADLHAAVELVTSGLASRVVLTGFPCWPGLLWDVHLLATEADVDILATGIRQGGRVDLEVRSPRPDADD